MEKLSGKRLLLLGGIPHAMEIVKAAHKLGVEVYVTDYNETTPCKAIADKGFTVSTTDVDAVVSLCRAEKIDGVITGFIDSMLPYCEKICSALHMPFWGTQDQIQVCINKQAFKQVCREFDIPLATEYRVVQNDGTWDVGGLKEVRYPVIVKPSDNSGSRGVFVCENEEALRQNYEKALGYSKSKTVIVEQYLCGQHVNMYYTLSNGEIYLSAMADRYVDYLDGNSAPLPVCLVHPSRFLSDFEAEVDGKIKNMFKTLGMKNGVAFVQGFRCNDGSFKIYEMGYRLNGGATYSLIEACDGYNQLDMMIHFSLTGEMGNDEILKKSSPHFDKLAINYVLSVPSGDIGKITGLDTVRAFDNMINVVQVRFDGDHIQGKGGSAQVIAYLLFVANDITQIRRTLDEVYKCVRVTDINGNPMHITEFDVSTIAE